MAVIVPALLLLALVAALVDIITRDEWQVKHIPKFGWVLLVVLLPLVGTILWFAIGREYASPPRPTGYGSFGAPAASAPRPTVDPRSTEQQLADLEREIDEYNRSAELEQRKQTPEE